MRSDISRQVASDYRILHAAKWTQPAEIYQNAPLISFGVEDTSLPFGFVRVYKTSLIFADIDAQLSPITPEAITDSSFTVNIGDDVDADYPSFEFQQPNFYISEKRRLKFEEIHYFDHPRFGVIMGVWPVAEDL